MAPISVRGSLRPSQSGPHSYVFLALLLMVVVLAFNYWSSSTKNSELLEQLSNFQHKHKVCYDEVMVLRKASVKVEHSLEMSKKESSEQMLQINKLQIAGKDYMEQIDKCGRNISQMKTQYKELIDKANQECERQVEESRSRAETSCSKEKDGLMKDQERAKEEEKQLLQQQQQKEQQLQLTIQQQEEELKKMLAEQIQRQSKGKSKGQESQNPEHIKGDWIEKPKDGQQTRNSESHNKTEEMQDSWSQWQGEGQQKDSLSQRQGEGQQKDSLSQRQGEGQQKDSLSQRQGEGQQKDSLSQRQGEGQQKDSLSQKQEEGQQKDSLSQRQGEGQQKDSLSQKQGEGQQKDSLSQRQGEGQQKESLSQKQGEGQQKDSLSQRQGEGQQKDSLSQKQGEGQQKDSLIQRQGEGQQKDSLSQKQGEGQQKDSLSQRQGEGQQKDSLSQRQGEGQQKDSLSQKQGEGQQKDSLSQRQGEGQQKDSLSQRQGEGQWGDHENQKQGEEGQQKDDESQRQGDQREDSWSEERIKGTPKDHPTQEPQSSPKDVQKEMGSEQNTDLIQDGQERIKLTGEKKESEDTSNHATVVPVQGHSPRERNHTEMIKSTEVDGTLSRGLVSPENEQPKDNESQNANTTWVLQPPKPKDSQPLKFGTDHAPGLRPAHWIDRARRPDELQPQMQQGSTGIQSAGAFSGKRESGKASTQTDRTESLEGQRGISTNVEDASKQQEKKIGKPGQREVAGSPGQLGGITNLEDENQENIEINEVGGKESAKENIEIHGYLGHELDDTESQDIGRQEGE